MGMTDGGGEVGSKSPVKIMANIFISFIGAGVLGLPFAFKEAGLLEGVLVMTGVALVSVSAMLLLIDCKYRLIQKDQTLQNGKAPLIIKETKGTKAETEILLETELNGVITQIEEPSKPEAPGQELTYGDVGFYAIGTTGRLLVEFSIVVSQIGFTCAYLIFISENLSSYIAGVKMYQWLLILLPPLAALTLLRHLSKLALTSLFAQCSNLLAFAVVFWFDFEHIHLAKPPKEINLAGLPFFLAVAIYCYEGAGMILSLEASLHKTVRHLFKTYFKVTMVIVTTLYIAFGAAGYLSFGPGTNPIITLNLPTGSSLDFALVVKSCLCIALFFTYPVMMFPVAKILESKLLPNPGERYWQGNLLRCVLVTITGLVVMAVPNFATLMALVGSSCCTLLAFILPGLFHWQITKGSATMYQKAFDIFLILLGIVGTIVGIWDAVLRLQEAHTGKPLHPTTMMLFNTTLMPPVTTQLNMNSTHP